MYVACSFVSMSTNSHFEITNVALLVLIHSTVGAKAHHISCSSKKHWHNLTRRDELSVAVKLNKRMYVCTQPKHK